MQKNPFQKLLQLVGTSLIAIGLTVLIYFKAFVLSKGPMKAYDYFENKIAPANWTEHLKEGTLQTYINNKRKCDNLAHNLDPFLNPFKNGECVYYNKWNDRTGNTHHFNGICHIMHVWRDCSDNDEVSKGICKHWRKTSLFFNLAAFLGIVTFLLALFSIKNTRYQLLEALSSVALGNATVLCVCIAISDWIRFGEEMQLMLDHLKHNTEISTIEKEYAIFIALQSFGSAFERVYLIICVLMTVVGCCYLSLGSHFVANFYLIDALDTEQAEDIDNMMTVVLFNDSSYLCLSALVYISFKLLFFLTSSKIFGFNELYDEMIDAEE